MFTGSVHGIHVLERMKDDPAIHEVPAIILTNIDNDEHRKSASELGALKYLVKAETPLAQVLQEVRQCLT